MCFVDDGSGGLLGVIFHFSGGALSPIRPPIHINGGGHVTLQGGWYGGSGVKLHTHQQHM